MCSGDLGPEYKAFHPDPEGLVGLDHIICESKYGDRTREKVTITQRRDRFEHEIKDATARGGNLIIPTFALERTQELLLDIVRLADANRIPNVPVFVDSPLASKATKAFASHTCEMEDICGDDVFHHPAIHYVEDVTQSMRLNSVSGAIILKASGVCEAGRIRHHLKHNLHRRESTILFVGFQAKGTLGRVIIEGAKRIRILRFGHGVFMICSISEDLSTAVGLAMWRVVHGNGCIRTENMSKITLATRNRL